MSLPSPNERQLDYTFPDISWNQDIEDSYINRDQRDVHIWSPIGNSKDRCATLIAGFYSQPPNANGNIIRYQDVIAWLDTLRVTPGTDSDHVKIEKDYPIAKDGTETRIVSWTLAKWHDPREWSRRYSQNMASVRLPDDTATSEISQPAGVYIISPETRWAGIAWKWRIIPKLDEDCEPGHYVLLTRVEVVRFKDTERQKSVFAKYYHLPPRLDTDQLHGLPSSLRPSSAGFIDNTPKETKKAESVPKYHRDDKVTYACRQRDYCCRVTATKPVERARGLDYSALQGAHIFALGNATPTIWKSLATENQEMAKVSLANKKAADIINNMVLLRADIHCYFDMFQFGVYPDGNKLNTYTIEKDVAGNLHTLPPTLIDQSSLDIDSAVWPWLFFEHFRLVLRLRFLGGGNTAK